MNETGQRIKFKKWLAQQEDISAYKIHGSVFQGRNTLDWFLNVRGLFVAIEFKQPGLHATPMQEHTIAEIRFTGGYATVVHSAEEAIRVVELVRERAGSRGLWST